MPRTREQFSEMKDERMASILDAALPLFSLYGKKVSIDAISERAKCSHGIVYHYFKNTDEIYEKLCKSPTFLEINRKLFGVKTGSSYEKIEEIITVLLDISNKTFNKICFLNILIKNDGKDSLFEVLRKLIKEGQNSGKIIGGNPAEIVSCVFFLLKGIYMSFLTEKHPNIQVPSVEIVMQMVRKPLSF